METIHAKGAWWQRTWRSIWEPIKPGPEASRGAYWAAIITVIWGVVVGGLNVKSGFGFGLDFLFAFLIAALGIPLVVLAVALLLTIFRHLPRLLFGFFVGAFLGISLLWRNSYGYWTSGLLLVLECLLGATLATMLFGGFRQAPLAKRILTITVLILCLAGNAVLFGFFHRDGINEEFIQLAQNPGSLPPRLTAANPSEPGSYVVKTLTYGNGDDLRRPEYGKAVAIHTGTVDASKFFKDFKGWKAYVRRRYWGFGMDKLPINGRVWYPEGAGPFPLVLMVHGNHNMSQFSDPGYAYLGNLMASRGFIFASLDENFINVGLYHEPAKEQAVRGWLLLEHLKTWHIWSDTVGNPFYKKVDVENVALMGHSRGGEAVATALLFNKLAYYPDDATIQFHYGFPIRAILAIAPVDGQYKPAGQWRWIQDVNYFTIHGSNDGDAFSFEGSRQWDHLRFSGHGDYFKSELYIYRANHGQFNTSWGRTDHGAPENWFLNLRSLLPGEDQRQIAKVYISAFLEATLHNRREYVPLFQDYRTGRDWVPHTLYVNRYLDGSNKVVSDFSEDADVTTTTVPGGVLQAKNLTLWREGKIPYRKGDRDYNGVFLGWNRTHLKSSPAPPVASYSIDLPATLASDWKLGKQSVLTMSMAVTDETAPSADKGLKGRDLDQDDSDDKPEPTDFTIVMETQDGARVKLPLSQFNLLLPPLKVKLTKLDYLDKAIYKEDSEPVFQSLAIPLATFAKQDARFDPAKLKTVRLVFDRTPSRVVVVSAIGFSAPAR